MKVSISFYQHHILPTNNFLFQHPNTIHSSWNCGFMGVGSSQSQRRDPNPSRHSFQPCFPLLVAGLELGVDSNCGQGCERRIFLGVFESIFLYLPKKLKEKLSSSLEMAVLGKRRRQWHPTPVLLPGESQGRGSLVGCRLWGRTESDTTDAT